MSLCATGFPRSLEVTDLKIFFFRFKYSLSTTKPLKQQILVTFKKISKTKTMLRAKG